VLQANAHKKTTQIFFFIFDGISLTSLCEMNRHLEIEI